MWARGTPKTTIRAHLSLVEKNIRHQNDLHIQEICANTPSAMGKSRSAAVVLAYMMHKYGQNPDEALAQLREGRGVCEPNDGFMEQLRLYHSMQTPEEVESQPAYQRWLYKRDLEASRAVRQAPDADKIRFEDEYAAGNIEAGFELKCRKCRCVFTSFSGHWPVLKAPVLTLYDDERRTLATSQYLVPHSPKQKPDDTSSISVPPSACAHYFVDPLSWMRPELEQGKLEGRLECPKCQTNVGKYAWQGSRCSCGDWMVPGISLQKTRIDEVKSRTAGDVMKGMGIRMPPAKAGMVEDKGNL